MIFLNCYKYRKTTVVVLFYIILLFYIINEYRKTTVVVLFFKSVDVFVEQCSLLDHDICDTLREPLQSVPRPVIERFRLRTELLETSTIPLLELCPTFANDCHHRMALIRAKMVQLERDDHDRSSHDTSIQSLSSNFSFNNIYCQMRRIQAGRGGSNIRM